MPSDKLKQFDKELAQAEMQVIEAKTRVSKLRRDRPREIVKDYTLKNLDGSHVQLSDLFSDKTDLILIHNMGKQCRYCTLWADGFNGATEHLENRAAYALVSNDEPQTAKEFAKSRGWTFKVLSGHQSDFTLEMGFADSKDHSPWPGVSTFRHEKDGTIVRVGKASFGPGDDFCSVWHLFDLLEGGAGNWSPKYTYE